MGTRNITQVILDGKTLVSQYCQWDGYPEGQGADILEFLKGMDRELFENRLRACTYPTAADFELMNKQNVTNHPTLTRNIGGGILQYIQDSVESVQLELDLDFVNESLFCEWAYVVDLDNNVLEVFCGFNTKPVPADNRFQPDGIPQPAYEGADSYYPVSLIKTFDLDNLPDEEAFIKACIPADETVESFQHDVFNNVVVDLRTMASGDAPEDKMLTHMMNYIEANKDDFMEVIED